MKRLRHEMKLRFMNCTFRALNVLRAFSGIRLHPLTKLPRNSEFRIPNSEFISAFCIEKNCLDNFFLQCYNPLDI